MSEEETLFMEPIVAWRYWIHGFHHSDERRLLSGCPEIPWEPMQPLKAVHHRRFNSSNKPCADAPCESYKPNHGYGCGIYGFKMPEFLRKMFHDNAESEYRIVIGQVYLWGRIFEHEHGYRAQFAYPKKLVYSDSWNTLRDIGLVYNVPVEEEHTWKSAFLLDESFLNRYMSPSPYGSSPIPSPRYYHYLSSYRQALSASPFFLLPSQKNNPHSSASNDLSYKALHDAFFSLKKDEETL